MTRTIAGRLAAGSVFVGLALTPASQAYEAVEVTQGGTVAGTVRLSGPVPEDPPLEIGTDVTHCGVSQPGGVYLVGPAGEVQNVLVVVENIEKGKAPPAKHKTVIDNRNCVFEPLVAIAYVGGYYVTTNSDPILHNTHLKIQQGDSERTLFNLALPQEGMSARKRVKRSGFVKVSCDLHSWMRAYVYASEHPYVAITDENGRFEIPDLPPGEYSLFVWHEGLGELTVPFEVSAEETSDLAIEYQSEA